MWVIGFERTKLLAFISRFDFVRCRSVATEASNALTAASEGCGATQS